MLTRPATPPPGSVDGQTMYEHDASARFAAEKKRIESRAFRCVLAASNNDEQVFEFTLKECRCEACQTALIGELAGMCVQLLCFMGGDWRGDLLKAIALRLDR